MSNDDNTLASALWLVVGGAAGYAAGRFVVGPLLADRSKKSLGSTLPSAFPPERPARALGAGPGTMQPIDPYGPTVVDGSSGGMWPIDPYADATPSITPITPVPTTTSPTTNTPTPADGPITQPPKLPSVVAPNTSGPITTPQIASSPNKLAPTKSTGPAPSVAFATKARVRRFDAVFARYRGDLPIEYVRALVERESDGWPSVRAGNAIGLMQIRPVVLADHNKRHGTAYRSEHLTDPAINVSIGCELLRLIIESYRKNHPNTPSLQADWNNPRFVELLTLGWNAGYSEAGGLGRVARYLEQVGVRDLDLDLIAAYARTAGATKHLSNPAKLAWCKSVAVLYQRERALARAALAA